MTESSEILRGSDTLKAFCGKLKILANPQRFRILLALTGGETAVSDLEAITNIKQPNLSHELRKLRDSEVVQTRKQSKVVFYSLSDDSMHQLIDSLAGRLVPGQRADQHLPPTRPHNNKGSVVKPGRPGECAHFPSIRNRRAL